MSIYRVGQRLRLKNLSGFEAQCAFDMPKNLLLLPGFIAEIVDVVRTRNGVFQYAEIHFDSHSDDVKFRVNWAGLAFFEKVTTEQLAREDMEALETVAKGVRNATPVYWDKQYIEQADRLRFAWSEFDRERKEVSDESIENY